MRLYRVEGEGNFTEYAKHEFSEQHFEQTLEMLESLGGRRVI